MIAPADILRSAAGYAREYEHARGAFARTAWGAECNPTDEEAYALCAEGAIAKAVGDAFGCDTDTAMRTVEYLQAQAAATDHLRLFSAKYPTLPEWSDKVAANGEEVAALLETVAAETE